MDCFGKFRRFFHGGIFGSVSTHSGGGVWERNRPWSRACSFLFPKQNGLPFARAPFAHMCQHVPANPPCHQDLHGSQDPLPTSTSNAPTDMQRFLAVRAFVNLTRAFVGLRISKESFPVGVKKRRAAKQRCMLHSARVMGESNSKCPDRDCDLICLVLFLLRFDSSL